MRWFLGVVVACATLARAESSAETVTHRLPTVAFRASVLAGGGFVIPEPACPGCEGPSSSSSSFSAGLELAVVRRWEAGESYFANQLVWYPIFPPPAKFGYPQASFHQMLAVTAEFGFLARVQGRALFGGGLLAALSFDEPLGRQRANLVAFGSVVMPGASMRLSFALDEHEVHRVGANLCVLVRLLAPGVVVLPTLSYSATVPW